MNRQRSDSTQGNSTPQRKPSVSPQPSSEADLRNPLYLQRTIGNQALQRLISAGDVHPASGTAQVHLRTPAGATQRLQRELDGLAAAASVESFAQEAVTYCRASGNADKPLTGLADHLMEKVNVALKSIPSYECNHTFQTTGTVGAFAGGIFGIKINTSDFSKRPGVTKVSDLNQAEIAEIVDTIYHEARHSEQYFRVARMLAGQGKNAAEIATQVGIPNIVAAEAVKSPLANTTANAGAISEAASWQDFIGKGKYVAYKVYVANLRDTIAPARAKLSANDRDGFKTEFAKITTIMTGKIEPLITQVDGISTKSTSDTLVLTDANAIKAAYDVVAALNHDTASVSSLRGKMLDLHNARYQAYRNYPHEVDAWARGGEAGAKYKELDTAAANPPPVTTPVEETPVVEPTPEVTPPTETTDEVAPTGTTEETPVVEPTPEVEPTLEPTGEVAPDQQEEEPAKKGKWHKRLGKSFRKAGKKIKKLFR